MAYYYLFIGFLGYLIIAGYQIQWIKQVELYNVIKLYTMIIYEMTFNVWDFVIYYLLSIIYYILFIIYYLLFIIYGKQDSSSMQG